MDSRQKTPCRDDAGVVQAACRRIEQPGPAPTLAELADAVGCSPHRLHRLFRARIGMTPRAYAQARRGEALRGALARPGARVLDAALDAGFNASSRFYGSADALLGMKPARYRDGGAGERIRFALGQCAFGGILVAASERGLCAIALGDDPEALLGELQGRFPRAELVGGEGTFEQWVARVVGFVEQTRLGLDLPLDIRGTAFQQRVWDALRKIPVGTTASYAAIAEQLGKPGSARAVATACAANALAVAIPCHRVVRRDGALSGYRWGVDRKRQLLLREAAAGGERHSQGAGAEAARQSPDGS